MRSHSGRVWQLNKDAKRGTKFFRPLVPIKRWLKRTKRIYFSTLSLTDIPSTTLLLAGAIPTRRRSSRSAVGPHSWTPGATFPDPPSPALATRSGPCYPTPPLLTW